MKEAESINLIYAVLCSEGNAERMRNVSKMLGALPEMKVFMSNRENVFKNHIRLFKLGAESGADGIVILEDDVQLCRDFKNRVESLVAEHKDEVVSMFESALAKGELKSEYRAGGKFNWCQCNYYPKDVCEKLADTEMLNRFTKWFFETRKEPWNYPIDTYIAYVLSQYKMRYWMQVPFLVQHLAIKSNFKGRPLNRQSKFFIDDMEDDA